MDAVLWPDQWTVLSRRDEDASGRAAGHASAAQIAGAVRSAEAELSALIRPGFGIVHRDLGRRYSDQFIADAMPTPSIVAGVDAPCRQLDAAFESLRTLQSASIAPLNAQLASTGLGALPAWSAPAAPACGAATAHRNRTGNHLR